MIGVASPFLSLLDAQNGAQHPEKIVGTQEPFPQNVFESILFFRRLTTITGLLFMPVGRSLSWI